MAEKNLVRVYVMVSQLNIKFLISYFGKKDFDTLILSCTHYPLVKNLFERVLGPEVEVFDPSIAVAERVKEAFTMDASGSGQTRFILSQESTVFRQRVAEILPNGNYYIEVRV